VVLFFCSIVLLVLYYCSFYHSLSLGCEISAANFFLLCPDLLCCGAVELGNIQYTVIVVEACHCCS
jgi:hypothetical protein